MYVGTTRRPASNDGTRAVGRFAVGDEDFKSIMLIVLGGQLSQGIAYEPFLISHRYYDRNKRQASGRDKGA
jgi:hypothetical protein